MVVVLRNLQPIEPLPERQGRKALRCPHCEGLVLVYRTPSKPGLCVLCRQRFVTPAGAARKSRPPGGESSAPRRNKP